MSDNPRLVEVWKPIPNEDGYYISSFGRLGSRRSIGRGRYLSDIMRIIIPQTNNKSYKIAKLCRFGGKFKCYLISRLVLELFEGPCPTGFEACHGPDFTPSNNKLSNLRWDTPENNRAEIRKNSVKGSLHVNAKLTERTVSIIRNLYLTTNLTQSELASFFGVKPPTMQNVVEQYTWKGVLPFSETCKNPPALVLRAKKIRNG